MVDEVDGLRRALLSAIPTTGLGGTVVSGGVDWLTLLAEAQAQRSRVPGSPEHALVSCAISEGLRGRPGALWWAVRENKPDYVGMLLSCGADPSGARSPGMTPLMLCARHHGNVRVARLLLCAGANIDGRASGEVRAAGSSGSAQMFRDSVLMRASGWGFVELVGFLLESGADATYMTPHGRTALHEVAMGGTDDEHDEDKRVRIAEMLVQRGALVHQTENYNWLPSEYAEWRGRGRLAGILRAAETRGASGGA
jgi:ankyrin repeat protein